MNHNLTFHYLAIVSIVALTFVGQGCSSTRCNRDILTGENNHENITARLGNPRNIRDKKEIGVPKGRWRGTVIHYSGTRYDQYKTNRLGYVKCIIDFKKGDTLIFKTKKAGKVTITNLAPQGPLSSIETSISQDSIGKFVYGELKGKLIDALKHNQIHIYANGKFIGTPDALFRYVVPTNDSGKVDLTMAINIRSNLVDGGTDSYDCTSLNCGICCTETSVTEYCSICCTLFFCQSIEINDSEHARVDLRFDDDQKIRRFLAAYNLSTIYRTD